MPYQSGMDYLSKVGYLSYYLVKPLMPRPLQLYLRRKRAEMRKTHSSSLWPIDAAAAKKPSAWQGWPDGKDFAIVLTHDVESPAGQDKCLDLMKLEKKSGFCSSFNFVARGYPDRPELRTALTNEGFEVGVHG
jgi:hypothetical protein